MMQNENLELTFDELAKLDYVDYLFGNDDRYGYFIGGRLF